jgi:hypothetical protein
VGDHFSNVVIRVKIIVTETVGGILAEVHTHIADRRTYRFFKGSRARILFAETRPVRIKNFISFYAHCLHHLLQNGRSSVSEITAKSSMLPCV